jgi:Flp pilus assembly protein TadG
MPFINHGGAKRSRSQGVAAVELAVCLPAIVVLVFASIESCSMIFLTQALQAATYEGARVAIQPSATSAGAIQRAQDILNGHGVSGATITCVPADVSAPAEGTPIAVVVSAPCDSNRVSPVFFFGSRNIEIRTTMAKE